MGPADWLRWNRRRVDAGPPDPTFRGLRRGVVEPTQPVPSKAVADSYQRLDGPAEAPPGQDGGLPPLSTAQAAWLRRLVRQAFAESGRECVVEGASAIDYYGTVVRLWHLASVCREQPERSWPSLVDGYVAAATARIRPVSPAGLRRTAHLRLMNVDALPAVHELAHCRAVAPGLVEVLTVENRTLSVVPPATALPQACALPSVLGYAAENLRAVIRSDLSAVTVRTRDGLSFSAVSGVSPYVASLSLCLPDLVEALEPGAEGGRGMFVAVPNRHQLAYRPVIGLSSLMSVQRLALFAKSRHASGVDPISPNVYWVRGGNWSQLTFNRGERVSIHVSAELTAAIGEEP